MFTKLKSLLLTQLKQGATPQGLALTSALAIGIAILPVLGTTTALCALVAYRLKLNQPLMQTLNYALYPVQIILIPAFIYLGESLVGAQHVSINPLTALQLFKEDWREFFTQYGWAGLYGFFAWALLAPPVSAMIYFLLLPVFRKLQRK